MQEESAKNITKLLEEIAKLREDLQLSGGQLVKQGGQLVEQGLFDECCRAQFTASTVYLEPTGKLGLCTCQELVCRVHIFSMSISIIY